MCPPMPVGGRGHLADAPPEAGGTMTGACSHAILKRPFSKKIDFSNNLLEVVELLVGFFKIIV